MDEAHQVLVIGHRGASAARPENTVEAFRHARELGADWVELDVRRTADGALVVHHDAHLPGGRAIVELRADELPPALPSLDEALDACVGLGVNVEIKNSPPDPDFDPDDWLAGVVTDRLVARADAGGHALCDLLVTSFNRHTVAAVRARAPELPTGLLAHGGSDAATVVRLAASGGHFSLNPWDPDVDARLVELAHDSGLAVYVWTVDDPDRMATLIDLGVDGIITNVPDVARAVVRG
jgi:glycerophosphoryl diester phosphodiesterase